MAGGGLGPDTHVQKPRPLYTRDAVKPTNKSRASRRPAPRGGGVRTRFNDDGEEWARAFRAAVEFKGPIPKLKKTKTRQSGR